MDTQRANVAHFPSLISPEEACSLEGGERRWPRLKGGKRGRESRCISSNLQQIKIAHDLQEIFMIGKEESIAPSKMNEDEAKAANLTELQLRKGVLRQRRN